MKGNVIEEEYFNPRTREMEKIMVNELKLELQEEDNVLENRELNYYHFYNTQELILRRIFCPSVLYIQYLSKLKLYRVELDFNIKSFAQKALDYLNNNINIRTYSYSEQHDPKYRIHFLISRDNINLIEKYYED